MADTAADQLERILYILPAAARDSGVSIRELAAALGVDVATVLRDIEHVTARAYYHPAGTVDSFSVLLDGRRVEVHAPLEFQRPVRLNQRETLALCLGLRSLAADAEPDRRQEILALAHHLEASLCAPGALSVREHGIALDAVPAFRPGMHASTQDYWPDADADAGDSQDDAVDYEGFALAFDDDGFRGVVADAIELRRVCTIWYLKPGAVAPAYRSIAPWRLIYADGAWYVAAYDLDREAVRFFRMDRVLDARLEDETAPLEPPGVIESLLGSGGPYSASDDMAVRVRYSPRIARWVAERTATGFERDGSVVLYHRVADPRWIVRHVLQYGGEAVVEEPAVARHWVATAAADVAAS